MPFTSRALVGLVASSVLLSGCSVLKAAVSPPEQSVADACASFGTPKVINAVISFSQDAKNARTGKELGKALDSLATPLEAATRKVENQKVKVQTEMTTIALRNFAAEARRFKPTAKNRSAVLDDAATAEKQLKKLADLCTWS
ncbi:MAG: hypothetical protein KDB60_07005 [Propionibacteriaceae bacterium]|nr:hypothetical protein [Propionibacteriaceae bacterium]